MLGESLRHKSKCVWWACRLSELTGFKNFEDLTEEDIQKFAAFYYKGEIESDRKHHWIGTYNQAQIHVIKFLKFVSYPNLPHKKRSRPGYLVNYDQLPRQEDFVYGASDMWSDEDHTIYLKYCSGDNIERDRALHMVFHDTSARPHELSSLKIGDIEFDKNRKFVEITITCPVFTKFWIILSLVFF
jgi:integrase